ncbi:MAG: ABC transporter ATP-binding protein [Spirochaetaceae bacterium]|nr:MAG: ABC transporter ATP-binding protein [Spirochaetaceae bacterium]
MLRVTDLQVHYGAINALKGVSLEVEEGSLVTLIGANGAGKTTLLNTISGAVPGSAGSILFRGDEILNELPHLITRRGIAHVPEGRKIFGELTVEDNLRVGAYVQKDKKRINTLIERNYELFPRLAERRRQEGGSLSGGEQQMLAIARGLMSDPTLLLLDEPSLGLAPILVEMVFELIKEINGLGVSVLLVEQNANIALQTATFGYVLETGRITLADNAAALLNNKAVQNAYLGVG